MIITMKVEYNSEYKAGGGSCPPKGPEISKTIDKFFPRFVKEGS